MRAAAATKRREKSFELSERLLEKTLRRIPSATQTFSKGHTQFPVGASPVFLERGSGAYSWDVDGNRYIDYPMALGANILGYADPAVEEAIVRQLKSGISFSLPHRLELEVAEMLAERIPCAEMARFGKNGSDVTSAAVRLARAATGREHIACCGYHGWQDWYIATTTRDLGIPKGVKELTHAFEYNKLETLKALFDRLPGKIAAVILEPIGVIDPAPGFLKGVADLARKNGAVLVFDEVVTGFRLARGGAQELYGVTPDLACFGKAMANGMPLSTLVGKRELMKKVDDIFFSFTAGGETLSLAAGKATMLELDRRKAFPRLWKAGDRLRDGFNAAAKAHGLDKLARCVGPGPHTVAFFKDEKGEDSLLLRAIFQQEVIARGILFHVSHNVCAALSDQDVEKTLAAYHEAFALLKEAVGSGDPRGWLKGRPVQAIFRKP